MCHLVHSNGLGGRDGYDFILYNLVFYQNHWYSECRPPRGKAMNDECVIDDEERVVASEQCEPCARKDHTCLECGETIKKGERYHHRSGITALYGATRVTVPWRVKICRRCMDDWDTLFYVYDPPNMVYGCLRDLIFGALNFGSFDGLDTDHPFWKTGMAARWRIYRDEQGSAYHIPE